MSSKHTIELTQDNFKDQVSQSDQPILVDFWADWCQPCRMVGPTIDELAEEYAGRVRVAKLDVDAHGEIASKLGISSIPTILLYREGEVIDKFVGVTTKEVLAQALDRVAA